MKPYIVEFTNNNTYKALIIGISSDSPHCYWAELENDLKEANICGKILLDCLFHSGNSSDRFIEVEFSKILNKSSSKKVILGKNDYFRKLSNKIITGNPLIIKNSILNDYQKKLLIHNLCL